MPQVKGSSNGRAKLSPAEVARIIAIHETGGRSIRKLAEEFGVSPMTVQKIVTGKAWATQPAEAPAVVVEVAQPKPAEKVARPNPKPQAVEVRRVMPAVVTRPIGRYVAVFDPDEDEKPEDFADD